MTSGKRTAACALVLVVTGIGAASFSVSAQAARTDDVLPALLVEMKGLRAAMEQMASGATQAHVLVGRLQLQETRIASMIHRLDTVRDNLASARIDYDRARDSLKLQEGFAKDEASRGLPAADNDYMLLEIKAQVAAEKANVDRLSAEEMQLAGDIAVEQQHWIAINQRLDELERALAKR
jgi:hypothetical protein